jgi:hypothetical protein
VIFSALFAVSFFFSDRFMVTWAVFYVALSVGLSVFSSALVFGQKRRTLRLLLWRNTMANLPPNADID